MRDYGRLKGVSPGTGADSGSPGGCTSSHQRPQQPPSSGKSHAAYSTVHGESHGIKPPRSSCRLPYTWPPDPPSPGPSSSFRSTAAVPAFNPVPTSSIHHFGQTPLDPRTNAPGPGLPAYFIYSPIPRLPQAFLLPPAPPPPRSPFSRVPLVSFSGCGSSSMLLTSLQSPLSLTHLPFDSILLRGLFLPSTHYRCVSLATPSPRPSTPLGIPAFYPQGLADHEVALFYGPGEIYYSFPFGRAIFSPALFPSPTLSNAPRTVSRGIDGPRLLIDSPSASDFHPHTPPAASFCP